MEIGKQYDGDYAFKKEARLHQSKFRAENLRVECEKYGNILKEEDATKGLNFYTDFDILKAVYQRYEKKYSKQLYANLLRSEHIPFNLFIPLKSDLEFAKNVFNGLFSDSVKEVKRIEIEYAPEKVEDYLNDRTAFDTYVEYIHSDGEVGILGIEVKYTELAYPLKKGSKEEKDATNSNSEYWHTAKKSGVFINWKELKFISDDFRQVWRNHLLGEKIKQVDKIKHFTSVIIYPKGNSHFRKVLKEYQDLLSIPSCIKGITYEELFDCFEKYSNSERFEKWIKYLRKRYLIGGNE